MKHLKSLMRAAVFVPVLFLMGCMGNVEEPGNYRFWTRIEYTKPDIRRSLAPQSPVLTDRSMRSGATLRSPVMLRIFKLEGELEMWRQDILGVWQLIAVYDICKFSGDLGPKLRVGDRQAPEGFYTITPWQMNPGSREFLSFDTGYPNAFDRAHKRTGSALMVHGGCSSIGCYAMQDAPMQDIYAAMRDAFRGGQREIQLHIYPFRMGTMTMAQHAGSKNMDFWRQLKVGYDLFEQRPRELDVKVSGGRYIVH